MKAKKDINPNNNPVKKSGEPKLSKMITTVLLIFLMVTVAYSLVSENKKAEKEVVSISELASAVQREEVKSILVEGSKLTVTFGDDSIKESKKEAESSLSESFSNYGVAPEVLSKVKIEIKDESGFGYVLLNILPILLPVLLFVVFPNVLVFECLL